LLVWGKSGKLAKKEREHAKTICNSLKERARGTIRPGTSALEPEPEPEPVSPEVVSWLGLLVVYTVDLGSRELL